MPPTGSSPRISRGVPPGAAAALCSTPYIHSVEDLDRYTFALSLGNGPHKYTDLLDDPSLPANDLAHISVGDTHFKDRLAVAFALGHRHLVGMIDKALHNVGQ